MFSVYAAIKMKLVDISSSCYAHLIDNIIYLYIENEFAEMFYIVHTHPLGHTRA